MVAARAFVVVRFRDLGVVFGRHTRDAPGTRVDGVLESTSVQGESVHYSVLALVRGFTAQQLEAILADLRLQYRVEPQVLERDEGAKKATLRYGMAIRDLRSPGLQALVRFQHLFGVPWTRVEAGEVSMCGEVSSSWDNGEDAAARIRDALEGLGVEAHVEVRKLSGAELETYATLQELLGRFTWSKQSRESVSRT